MRTLRIKIRAVCWRTVKVTTLKGVQLYWVNSQWWKRISKEMLVVTWVPPNTHTAERNVIFQADLVLTLYHLSDTSAESHHKYADCI